MTHRGVVEQLETHKGAEQSAGDRAGWEEGAVQPENRRKVQEPGLGNNSCN